MIHTCSICRATFDDIFVCVQHERQHDIATDLADLQQEAQEALLKEQRHECEWGHIYEAMALQLPRIRSQRAVRKLLDDLEM